MGGVVSRGRIRSHGDLNELEEKLGYSFVNKALLLEALTHKSHEAASKGRLDQRLEFLGDAVLNYLLAKYFIEAFPTASRGDMNEMRIQTLRQDQLAKRIAGKLDLRKHIQHRERAIVAGPQDTPKVLGDIVGSLVGSIALDTDGDMKKTWSILRPLLSLEELREEHAANLRNAHENTNPSNDTVEIDDSPTDNLALQTLSALCSEKNWTAPIYTVTEGGKNRFRYSVRVYRPDSAEPMDAEGSFKPRKKEAKRAAAQTFVQKFGES